MEEVDGTVKGVIGNFIKSEDWDLNDYLDALDKGNRVFEVGDIVVQFHPDHNVTVQIPVNLPGGYSWAFRPPINHILEVEANGTFEDMLS